MNSLPPLIQLSGPFGPALTLLGLVVLVLTGRALWSIPGKDKLSGVPLREQANAILFWGAGSAVLGFLGQCMGVYISLSFILEASEVEAHLLAEGAIISFLPTLMGMAIFSFSAVVWACLRLLPRGGRGALPLLGFLLILGACGGGSAQRPAGITDGVWAMEAGPSVFLWEFFEEAPQETGIGTQGEGPGPGSDGSADASAASPLLCVVHDIQGGLNFMETPCVAAHLEGDLLTLDMPTGVRYEGRVELDRGRINGKLLYTDGNSMEAPLEWSPRGAYSTLEAMPSGEGSYAYRTPGPGNDGLTVAEASSVGVDPQALERTVASVLRGDAGFLKSLLVFRGESLILEEYFHGYGPENLSPIQSCTKSVSSLLVGLAIQEGHIAGVEAPLLSFFPELRATAGRGWEELTLEHLLTMSLALDWSPEEADGLHGTGPEAFRQILSRDVVGRPGEDWAYVSMNVNLLAGVLHEATGEHAEAFAARTLFGPLGIQEWNWDYGKTDGFNLMDGSLRLRPRDMAKLGVMVMNGGHWEGRPVLSEEWLRESLTPRLAAGSGGEGYGYLWWTMDVPGPGGAMTPVVFANGWGSQFILLFPGLELVVVTTGGNQENGKHLAVGEVLIRDLLPGITSGDAESSLHDG